MQDLAELLDQRVAVLDGAWGTMIQGKKLAPADYHVDGHERDTAGDPDLLNLTRPDVVLDIHRQYLAAGADITTTNTFTSTSFGQSDYGLEHRVYEMNVRGAQLARQAADEADGPRYVAGSVGPLNVTLSLSPRVEDAAYRAVTFDQVKAGYSEQIAALREGGVDVLLIETIFDTLNAKAAVTAAREVAPDLPLWLSVTITDLSGRTLSGQTIEAFWNSVAHANPLIVGVNCSLGGKEIRPHVADLARVAGTYTACHPNAGLPNAFGGYDEEPADTAHYLREFAAEGLVNVAGGGAGGRTLSRDNEPMDIAAFRYTVELNTVGTFNVTRLAAARMATAEPDEYGQRGVVVLRRQRRSRPAFPSDYQPSLECDQVLTYRRTGDGRRGAERRRCPHCRSRSWSRYP